MTSESGSYFDESSSLRGPKPKKRRRQRFRIYLAGLLLAALAPTAYFGWQDMYSNLLERERPSISLPQVPDGLGIEPIVVKIKISDSRSGLGEVIIRSDQNGKLKPLFRKKYEEAGVQEDVIPLQLSREENQFEEGEATILVTVFDRSLWSNRRLVTFELRIDFRRPQIGILTPENRLSPGGSGLVFYRVVDSSKTFNGVRVGPRLFPGFPAKELDDDFSNQHDLFFAFFAVPLDFEPGRDTPRVFARDRAGNFHSADLRYLMNEKTSQNRVINLSRPFLESRVSALYDRYLEQKSQIDVVSVLPVSGDKDISNLLERFRVVNTDYRKMIRDSLQAFFARPIGERVWQKEFLIMKSSHQVVGFGDRIKFQYDGIEIGEHESQGVRLLLSGRTPVRAASRGIVVFAEDLGPYGKTVILDHGFGLSTLYGQLSATTRKEGDRVQRAEIIGTTGSSGLVQDEYLHFEVRLSGIPVNPEEWWDKEWVTESIENKTKTAKHLVGIIVKRYLP